MAPWRRSPAPPLPPNLELAALSSAASYELPTLTDAAGLELAALAASVPTWTQEPA